MKSFFIHIQFRLVCYNVAVATFFLSSTNEIVEEHRRQYAPIGKYFITIYTNISFFVPTLSSLHTPSSTKTQFLKSSLQGHVKALLHQRNQIKLNVGFDISKYVPFSSIRAI